MAAVCSLTGRRTKLGGGMLAPGDGTDHQQVIDVRDLAKVTCMLLERDLGGAFEFAGRG